MFQEAAEATARPALRIEAADDSCKQKNRKTSFKFFKDVRKVGRDLNAATVLEGSVRKAGNRLRITMQLIDVATGYDRWSDTYDYDIQDDFNVQQETSRAIVNAVLAHKGGNPARSR